jgi:enolase
VTGKIERLIGRRVWDSRGRPTVEAEIHVAGGFAGRALAPAGASAGSGEAVDLRDGGKTFGGLDVTRAVASVNGEIARALVGQDVADQEALDRALIDLDGTPNKNRLGGNALVAVSMALAHAAAATRRIPLWQHLSGGRPPRVPVPEIQIYGGGAHAGRRVDLQDFMVIATGATSFAQALDWTAEIYRHAGLILARDSRLHGVADEGGHWPAFSSNEEALDCLVQAIAAAGFRAPDQVAISLDIAATQLWQDGRYRLGLEKRALTSEEFEALLAGWLERYPVVAIEDPVAENEMAAMARFTARVQRRAIVVGDDFLVTNAGRIQKAAEQAAVTAALIKPNQAGTLSETRAAFQATEKAGWRTIVSARSGETEDVTICHLAAGWGADVLKVGSFARSERMAKWNECLRLAEIEGASFTAWRPATI